MKKIEYKKEDKKLIKEDMYEIYQEIDAILEIAEEVGDKRLIRKLKKLDDAMYNVMALLEEERGIFPDYLILFKR